MRLAAAVLLGAMSVYAHAAAADEPNDQSRKLHAGKAIYEQYCQSCHGAQRQGGEAAPPLTADSLEPKWRGRSAKALLDYVTTSMPPGQSAALTEVEHRQVVTHLLQELGWFPADQDLPLDNADLYLIVLPNDAETARTATQAQASAPLHTLLEGLAPVTDSMLIEPPKQDWLMWRRTYDSHGVSPLHEITDRNAKDLRLVWSWTMHSGRGVVTPLVHDGVMFLYGPGDRLYAFDAGRGDLLWRYDRKWTGKSIRFSLRSISIYRDLVIFPADDGSVVALDMRTGKVRWDRQVLDPSKLRFSGGPVIADGAIVMGTSTGTDVARNFVVALDAANGEERWRWYTVPNPDEPGGDTWNNIPAAERMGAGVWAPGSYDPASHLAFFGTGNNYFNLAALRKLSSDARSNAALHTNSTLALDVRNGRLAWHFQHLPTDQWNYDWAFERTVLDAPVDGERRKVVMTAGKQGIFDAMQLTDGAYQFSVDLGLQNVVRSIDPVTGAKNIDPEAIPQEGVERLVCPSSHGVRNWMPTAFSATKAVFYIPFLESCMTVGDPAGSVFAFSGFGQTGVPRPDSDGRLGGLRAINAFTGKTLWSVRRRGVPTTGVLATDGNLAFAGFLDRVFAAYRASDGEELWQVRLNDIPSAAPISFMTNGVQYIAVITGHQAVYARNIDREFMAPEIEVPEEPSATVWVFALPE